MEHTNGKATSETWATRRPQAENQKLADKRASDTFSNTLLDMAVAIKNQLAPSSASRENMTFETRAALDKLQQKVLDYIAPTHGTGNAEHTPWYEVRKQRIEGILEVAKSAVAALSPSTGYQDIGIKNTLRPQVEAFITAAKHYETRLDKAKEVADSPIPEYMAI